MSGVKKFLDASGVTYLAQKLDNYPDNEILTTVIDAIGQELETKVSTTELEDELSNFTVNVNNIPNATQSAAGLMSSNDKQVLDNLNPNVITTIEEDYAQSISMVNAKHENLIGMVGIAEPIISTQTRTINLLDVNAPLEEAYINGSGVITAAPNGTDRMGPWIEITPGQDIYYTGITNPEANATQKFNRRLHCFDSNHTWIQQLNYVQVTGPNAPWSVHGVMPSNAAYVRVAWNEGDYHIMVTEGAPNKYYPYYLTPFVPITSVDIHVTPDGVAENGNTYTLNVPQAAGNLYSFMFDPVAGVIHNSTVHIAEYDGTPLDTIYWWSDRDTYSPLLQPSVGAEVVYVIDEEDYVDYEVTPLEIPLYYHNNTIWIDNGSISSLTYAAESLDVHHLTIEHGVTFGETNIYEDDVIAWNNTVALMDSKANVDSPIFTGTPAAPNPGKSSNSTRLATTSFTHQMFGASIAPIESNKASTNYSAGQYLMYQGQLYKVIDTIISGQTLTIDSNIQATDVATELNLLFTQLNGGNV